MRIARPRAAWHTAARNGSRGADDGGDRRVDGREWALRTVPAELRRAVPGRGLVGRRHPGRRWSPTAWAGWATSAFRVHSKVRPWSGTFAEVDRSARALAGALRARGRRRRRRGRVPAPELGRGRHHVLGRRLPGRRRGADRALLRGQGGRLHPAHRPGPRSWSPPTASATPTTSPPTRRCSPSTPARDLAGGRRHPGRPAPAGEPWPSPTCSTAPSRSTGPAPGRPRRAGGHRLHLGHHPRPEGRDPLAPHHRLRDPPARPPLPRRAARPRSPARRWATSSGWSTPSSSRCCASGRSTCSTSGTRARCCG